MLKETSATLPLMPFLFVDHADWTTGVPPLTGADGSLIHVAPKQGEGVEGAVIYTGWTVGDVDVAVQERDTPPDDDLTGWETVEQHSIDLTAPTVIAAYTSTEFYAPPENLIELNVTGLLGIRVSARGRARDRSDVQILIQLWPVTARQPLQQLKVGDDFSTGGLARRMSDGQGPYPSPDGRVLPQATTARPCASPTPDRELGEAWNDLRQALHRHMARDPSELTSQGTTADKVAVAEASTGVSWPEQLRTWFRLGIPRADSGIQLLPQLDVLDLTRAVALHRLQVSVWEELIGEEPAALAERSRTDYAEDEAGSEVGLFLPFFVPFAERDGDLLVCDTRPGPLRGCITYFYRDNGDFAPPVWASFGAMLTDLAASVERNAPFELGDTPVVAPDGMTWR